MRYQVFIPAVDRSGFNVTLTVEATNWLTALRAGLHELGEQAMKRPPGLMLNIGANGIHVADPVSKRVFRIRELDAGEHLPPKTTEPATAPPPFVAEPDPESRVTRALPRPKPKPMPVVPAPRSGPAPAPAPARAPAPASARAPVPAPAPAPVRAPAPAPAPVRASAAVRGVAPTTGSAGSPEAPGRRPDTAPPPAHLRSQRQEIPVARVSHEPKSPRSRPTPPPQKRRRPSSVIDIQRVPAHEDDSSEISVRVEPRRMNVEEVLAEVFEEIQELFFLDDLEEGVNFVLDLAMHKVPSQAGSILFADINARDLYFMAARGPKAQEVMAFRVPMGKGIVGFAAVEGMALAVSDVKNDPRFYKEISDRIEFDTRSILCAPVHVDGRCMGAIELINRQGTESYSSGEVNIVSYVADQFGRWLRDNIG